jgi:hypothetical protein
MMLRAVGDQAGSEANEGRASVDLLSQAIAQILSMLVDQSRSTQQRAIIFWAAAKAARNFGASDVVADAFLRLARESGLIDDRGRWVGADIRDSVRHFGAQDLRHAVDWALQGRNPFASGGR